MGLSPVDGYLMLYNGIACLGWAMVIFLSVTSLLESFGPGAVDEEVSFLDAIKSALASVYGYANLAEVLTYAQGMAVLEIVHAAVGFVRSPVMVTFMQVSSRIVALYAIINSPDSQTQWGAGLMIISWALVEVPRYAFYVFAIGTGDATKGTPYPLFWLRYSLFAVLYPTGITGELTVFLAAAADEAFGPGALKAFYGTFLPITYFFGSPFMIMNMAGNRAKAFKKRFAKPPPPPRGIVFPLDDKGQRSSTPVNKAILAAAMGAVSPELEQKVIKAKGWRFGYVKYLSQMLQEQCQSPEMALKVAEAGLNKAYDTFQFVYPDGKSVSVKEAMAATSEDKFLTGHIKGTKPKNTDIKLEVPYKGKILSGQPLIDVIQGWVDYGTIEPSCGEAVINCVKNEKQWLDLSDRYFVLLGAGSAMGPFLVLMALGANVIAIDLDRAGIWKRLINIAKESSGTITFPLRKEQSKYKTEEDMYGEAGCNLFTHTPMIRDWLVDLYPDKSFTVGSYAYLDGALHVQVSLAMDAIVKDLSEKRKGTSVAYLCTPTDLHLIPKEAHEAAAANYKSYSKDPYCMMMNLLSNGKFLRKNAKEPVVTKDETYYYVNGISVAQGPNYALAKRMQHWRAIIANSKGCIVSSNIAPSTSTVSVVHNRTFAWAYEGMPYFRPFEIFAPETSNAVMSALLFSDLNDPSSSGNPATKHKNPNQLFSYGSFHGGLWRCAYMVDSIGESSVLIYFSRLAQPYLIGGGVVVAAVIAKVAFM